MELFCLFGVIVAYLHDNAPRIFKGILLLGMLLVLCMLVPPAVLILFLFAIIVGMIWISRHPEEISVD